MAPALLELGSSSAQASVTLKATKPARPTNILHRTPWQPPIAIAAQGSYIELESGQKLLDGVGGAAVACLGNSHPSVMQAIKDQVDKVSCAYTYSYFIDAETLIYLGIPDVYNMQLSNEPAEALANKLIQTSNGAFTLCGFASGGELYIKIYPNNPYC